MPTIAIKQDLYNELQELMAYKLKERLKKNPKEAMLKIIKNKFGMTFDITIRELLIEYKKNNKIK